MECKKETAIIAFHSRPVSNGDTILVSVSSSTSTAGPGQGRGHAFTVHESSDHGSNDKKVTETQPCDGHLKIQD